jgi:hypothetical protein
MDKVHNPSDSECYTGSSEPFIFELLASWTLSIHPAFVYLKTFLILGELKKSNLRTGIESSLRNVVS